MKYLKTFEGYNDKSLAREIAEDLLILNSDESDEFCDLNW
jgi:hypothetical protein